MQCLVVGMGGCYRHSILDKTTIIVLTTLKVKGHIQDHTLVGFTNTAAVVLSRRDSKVGENHKDTGKQFIWSATWQTNCKTVPSLLACLALLEYLVQQNH